MYEYWIYGCMDLWMNGCMILTIITWRVEFLLMFLSSCFEISPKAKNYKNKKKRMNTDSDAYGPLE